MPTEPLVSTDWLAEHLGDPKRPRGRHPGIRDDQAGGSGRRARNLSRRPRGVPGGPHSRARSTSTGRPTSPTPTIRCPRRSRRRHRFAEAMAVRGIGDGTTVIAVDHARRPVRDPALVGLALLRPRRRRVLDGGWNRWVEEGREVESGEVTRHGLNSHLEPGRGCASLPKQVRRS